MPISFQKPHPRSLTRRSSRRENNYQNRLSKQYLKQQTLLKEVQTHPESLRTAPSAPLRLNAWQQILLLSSLFAIQPVYGRAHQKSTAPPRDSSHAPLSPITAPSVSLATAPSLAPSIRGSLSTLGRDASATPSPNSLHSLLPQSFSQQKSPAACHNTLDCFSTFLREAGYAVQTQFAHLLLSNRRLNSRGLNNLTPNHQTNIAQSRLNNIEAIDSYLHQTFPEIDREEIRNTAHVKKFHRRRHLEQTPPTSIIPTNLTGLSNHLSDIAQIDQRLEAWANLTQTEHFITSPSNALGAVLHHYNTEFPDLFLSFFDIHQLDNLSLKLVDEAARLYSHAQDNQFNVTETTSTEILRKNFFGILIPDLKKEAMLKNMLLPSFNGSDATVFFDGLAIRGAFGKNIDTLLSTAQTAAEFARVPGFKELSPAMQRTRLKEKLERLGENSEYLIGSTAQSLATTIHRLLSYQGQTSDSHFSNEKILFERFHQLELEWETHRNYPIHPRLLLAEHLAHASDLEIRPSDWKENFWRNNAFPHFQQLIKTVQTINPEHANNALIWLGSYFTYWNHNGQSWGSRGIAIQREAFSSLFNHLKELAYHHYPGLPASELKSYFEAQHYTGQYTVTQYKTRLEEIIESLKIQSQTPQSPEHNNWLQHQQRQLLHSVNIINEHFRAQEAAKAKKTLLDIVKEIEIGQASALPSGQPPDLIILFAKQMTEKMLSQEFIIGDDWRTHTQALIEYATDRLQANYGTAPSFSRASAAYDILIKSGVDSALIYKRQHYTMATENTHIQKTHWGSRIEEFLHRADWSSLFGTTMHVRDSHNQLHAINTQEALQTAEEEWNKNLPHHPWVQARARENCRLARTLSVNSLVEEEIQRLSKNYLAETEEHRQLMTGLEVWINTIPVIGPIYNIEEGIRHKDTEQIIFGTLFLGIDAFDVLTGGRNRSPHIDIDDSLQTSLRTPSIEHVTAGVVESITTDLDISLPKLTATSQSIPTISNHPHTRSSLLQRINTDPWKIELSDANVPVEYRSLAARVRAGESAVVWAAPNNQQYAVISLANENRIIAVQKVGAAYCEVSWENGHILRSTSFIHYDPNTKLYISSGLKGGGKPSGDTLIDNQPLRKRQAVREIKELLKKAKNVDLLPITEQRFAEFFSIPPESEASTFKAHTFYTKLYNKSTTFRRLANHFFYKHRDQWLIIVENTPRPYIKSEVSSIEFKSIYIPNDQQINSLQYRGIDSWHTFMPEQIYLDGLLPVLVTKGEMIAAPLNARSANIALRDRILFEAGYPLPQQPSSSSITLNERETGLYDTAYPNPEPQIEVASKALILEDRYLDPVFDEKVIVDAQTELLGTSLSERFTIKEVTVLEKKLLASHVDPMLEEILFYEEILKTFDLSGLHLPATGDTTILNVYQFMFNKSYTFRDYWRLANTNELLHEEFKWKFVVDPEIASDMLPANRRHSAVNPLTNTIYILPDDLFYLSENGFVAVEIERKLVHEMMHVLTQKNDPAIDIWTNRGAIVHLTEKILKEAGFKFPHRLAYGVVTGEQLRTGQFRDGIDPRRYQTTAQRARDMEERYLKSTIFKASLIEGTRPSSAKERSRTKQQ